MIQVSGFECTEKLVIPKQIIYYEPKAYTIFLLRYTTSFFHH